MYCRNKKLPKGLFGLSKRDYQQNQVCFNCVIVHALRDTHARQGRKRHRRHVSALPFLRDRASF